MTTQPAQASRQRQERPDLGDLAVAVVRHLWIHPKHDPKCKACLAFRGTP